MAITTDLNKGIVMITIKFSHKYAKMPDDYQESMLLAVLPTKLEDLSKSFLQYDTAYIDGSGELKFYELPDEGDYMILLLISHSDQLWTTMRRMTPEKIALYRSNVGNDVNCEVTEEC